LSPQNKTVTCIHKNIANDSKKGQFFCCSVCSAVPATVGTFLRPAKATPTYIHKNVVEKEQNFLPLRGARPAAAGHLIYLVFEQA
jgi:hypothetical protein